PRPGPPDRPAADPPGNAGAGRPPARGELAHGGPRSSLDLRNDVQCDPSDRHRDELVDVAHAGLPRHTIGPRGRRPQAPHRSASCPARGLMGGRREGGGGPRKGATRVTVWRPVPKMTAARVAVGFLWSVAAPLPTFAAAPPSGLAGADPARAARE